MPEHKNKPSPENGMFTFTFGAGNRSEWATSLSTRGVAHMLPSLNAFTPPAPPPTITVSYYENQNQGGSESGMDAKPAHLVTPPPPLPLTISVSNYKSHKEAGMNQKPPLYHDIKASMDQVKNTDTDSLGEGNGKERIGKKEMGKDGELTLADIAKMDLPPFMKAYVQFLEQTRLAPGLEGEEVEPISPAQLRAMGQEVMSQLQQGVPQHKIRIPFVAAMDADTLPSNVRAMKTLGDLCEDSGLHEQMRLDPCDANVTETLEGRERFWGTQLLALGDELRVEQMQQEEEQDGVLEVQNGKTIEGASEKEKKRRRRPKSKRPGPQQQVESESVVDLGTKMQGLHLNTKEASAMDSGRGKQNEHQPNPIPLEPSREDIDFQMNKILSLSIELVHHTGRTEHNANAWMGGILERLKLANMLLAAFWFMPGREQNGGEEYAEMMNLIADLVGDWRSLDEEVDKKGLIGETWGDEVNGRIRAVVEKNRELVKEWLWMGVLKNEGIGGEKGPRKENMQKRSLEKEDGDELEDLESNESMEYITPTSIFGKDFRNTKVSDKKNRTRGAAKSDSQPALMESTLVPLPLRVKASSLFNDRLLTPQPLNKSLDSTANISQRLANIEAFLQAALTPNHSPASNPTALAELKDSIQDIKDTIYGNHDHLSSEDLAERSNAKNRGLLFLCKLAEEWAKDSKYSSEFVERAVLGDEKGEGLVGLCRSIKDGIVKCGGWQQLENEKRELQRILRTCIDEIVAKRDLERENRHLDLELDRDMHDEEVAKLKMQNETLKMELCESRRGRMELVDKMLELDREVEEKDSALMEVLWPQGELSERKVVRRGRYRKDEMLAESRKLAGELGEKGWCGVM